MGCASGPVCPKIEAGSAAAVSESNGYCVLRSFQLGAAPLPCSALLRDLADNLRMAQSQNDFMWLRLGIIGAAC